MTLEHLDRRSIAYRRARALADEFARSIGGAMTEGARLLVERAATLQALAEDRRARVLNGEVVASLDDLVRLDRLAAQARRELSKLRPVTGSESALNLPRFNT